MKDWASHHSISRRGTCGQIVTPSGWSAGAHLSPTESRRQISLLDTRLGCNGYCQGAKQYVFVTIKIVILACNESLEAGIRRSQSALLLEPSFLWEYNILALLPRKYQNFVANGIQILPTSSSFRAPLTSLCHPRPRLVAVGFIAFANWKSGPRWPWRSTLLAVEKRIIAPPQFLISIR